MVKGSLFHRILSGFYKADEDIIKQVKKTSSREDIYALYRNKYLSIARNAIILNNSKLLKFKLRLTDTFNEFLDILNRKASERSALVYAFAQTFNVHGLADRVYPKLESNVFVQSKMFQLRGEVDLIEQYPEVKLPIETKFSKPPANGVWESDQIQLGAYLLILNQAEPVTRGFVEYGLKRVAVVLNPFIEKRVLLIRDKIMNMIDTKIPPEVKADKSKCRHCSVRKHCPVID